MQDVNSGGMRSYESMLGERACNLDLLETAQCNIDEVLNVNITGEDYGAPFQLRKPPGWRRGDAGK